MVMSAGSRIGRTRVPTTGAQPAFAQKNTTGTFTGSSTTVFVMAGLALTITPKVTGNILVTFQGFLTSTAVTINEGTILQIAYGTGNPPANNAAAIGTLVGEPTQFGFGVAQTTAADFFQPISLSSLIQGLTPGVTYWIDIQVKAVTGINVIVTNDPVLTAIELGGSQPATAPVQVSGGPGPVFGGRLTLTSGTPVLNVNTTAQGTVFYTPADVPGSGTVAIYNGSNFANYPFTEQSVVLDSTNWLLGQVYDWWMFLVGTTPTLGYNAAWTTPLAPSAARSAALARLNGVRTNAAQITIRTSSGTTFVVPANQATYVGSGYGTANAQTGMNFNPAAALGGNNLFLALYNAQNKVPILAISRDSTASWTYATNTWHVANSGGTGSGLNNRISWLDGLADCSVLATYSTQVVVAATLNSAALGVTFNSTSATPAQAAEARSNNAGTAMRIPPIAYGVTPPILGLSFAQAMEIAPDAATVTFESTDGIGAAGQLQRLTLQLSM
jgi:hypothetical protein